MNRGEELVELSLGEIELDLVQGIERFAEMDQDQVALVANLGVESGPHEGFAGGAFQIAEQAGSRSRNAFAVR
jgi:hypothetical protein